MKLRLGALLLVLCVSAASAADWLRPGPDGRPIWGIPGGIRFAIFPGSVEGPDVGGPRGLIRLGYPAMGPDGYLMLNFIAIEPIVNGVRNLSELDEGGDGKQGMRLSTPVPADPGRIETPADGVERLHVRIDCERFKNGAHVFVNATLRADRPNEVHLTVHQMPGSAPIEKCVLTATMGNKARIRRVALKDGELSSQAIFGSYTGNDFADPPHFENADRLARNSEGDVVVPFYGDEENPAAVHPPGWDYPGRKLTQYWRKPAGSPQNNLRLRVNARYKYWLSVDPIPGGVAFENVELEDNVADGESWVYGITPAAPHEVIAEVPPRP
jgi:hypothetical protein